MYKIPRIVPWYEDEMLSSWVVRLAVANGFADVRKFIHHYFYPDEKNYRYHQLLNDYRDNLHHFWSALPENSILPSELLIRLSTFTGTSPFMSEEQRQRYLCQCFYRGTGLEALFPLPHGTVDKVKVCPVCMKEEKEQYGSYWIHRAAQMPGVRSCSVHNTALKYVDWRRIQNLNSLPLLTDIPGELTFVDLNYSAFCRDFLNAQFAFSSETVSCLIEQGLSSGNSLKEGLSVFEEECSQRGNDYRNFFERHKLRIDEIYRIRRGGYIPEDKELGMLFLIYHTVDKLRSALVSPEEKDEEAFRLLIDNHGYSLLGSFRNDVVSLRHRDCGTVFAVSPYGFRIGWRCPSCNSELSVQEQFETLVRNIGHSRYRAVSSFEGMDTPMEFIHTACGKSVVLKPRSFVYEGVRCACETKYSFEEAAEKVSENRGFRLLEYKSTDDTALIEHSCGARFRVHYQKFLLRPYCRVCERNQHYHPYTDQEFNEEITALTGGEYELVGHYTNAGTRVNILHTVCGTVHDYKPFFFLDGARCPICTSRGIPEAKFISHVSEISDGRYMITGRPTRNLYEITDTATGKIQNLSRPRIIQELQRPTPSQLLPNNSDRPAKCVVLRNREDLLFERLSEMCPDGGLIFWDDVIRCVAGEPEIGGVEELYQALRQLVAKGRLHKVAQKIYSLHDNLFTVKEVITAKYLMRDGHHIGFLRGPQFAREIGLTSYIKGNDDNAWHIATNMESSKTTQRRITFLGEEIHIKGSREKITDDNWLVLAVLDFVIQYRQVVGIPEDGMLSAVREYITDNSRMLSYRDFLPYMNYRTANIRVQMDRLIGRLLYA